MSSDSRHYEPLRDSWRLQPLRGVLIQERRSPIDQLVVEVIHESNPPLAIGDGHLPMLPMSGPGSVGLPTNPPGRTNADEVA
jgi:hypothetical protein